MAKYAASKTFNAPKNAMPQAQPNPQKMIIAFIEQQEKLLQLIERARKINISRVRIPISISQWIKLKLGDTFLFLIAHQYRHTLQIERILKGKQLEFVV